MAYDAVFDRFYWEIPYNKYSSEQVLMKYEYRIILGQTLVVIDI